MTSRSNSLRLSRSSSNRSMSPSPGLYRASSTSANASSSSLSTHQKGRGQWLSAIEDPRDDDVIIPIMGPTGAGKSSLINQLAGEEVMKVGHGLYSCTSSIQHTIISHPTEENRRIILVDTPGFDDTYLDDVEILKIIARWLAHSYGKGMRIAGIVYLHEICQSRMMGTACKNLKLFRKLCGDEALKTVVLGTTKWDDVLPTVGQYRETQLYEKYWKEMVQHGSVIMRVHADSSSAWEIVDRILGNEGADFVLIQEELVKLQMIIPQTSAGQELRFTLRQLLELQTDMARELEIEGRVGGQDRRLQRELAQTQDQIRVTVHQIDQLKVPVSFRIKGWLRL